VRSSSVRAQARGRTFRSDCLKVSTVLTQQRQPSHQIALLKPIRGAELIDHALQLFDSMLWVFRGTTRATWSLSSPAEADVVVVHHAESAERIAHWRAQGKVIVVLNTESAPHQVDEHTLIYPFPASQVMSLLERLDTQLDGLGALDQATSGTVPAARPPAPAWALIESIRTLRAARNPSLWLAVQDLAQPLLWLRGDAAQYQCSAASHQAWRQGSLPLGTVTLEKSAPPSYGRGCEFTWFAAYHSSTTLAPWLSETVAYRLCRWPDLGVLRPSDPAAVSRQMRLIAALSSAPATTVELARRARVDAEEVIRTFNALSACELLEPAAHIERTQHAAFAIERPKLGFRQLFDSIRRHLWLGGWK
jgi:hypothetical protein